MESSFFAYAGKKRKEKQMECEEAVYSNDFYNGVHLGIA